MKELIATIHFIGLALFSTQVPNTPGLHVLLPRVESHQHEAAQPTPPVADPATQDGVTVDDLHTDLTTVEPHQAFIVFDQKDLIEEIGWTSEEVPPHMIRAGAVTTLQYRFVRLTGERVQFQADGTNAAAEKVRLPLPRPMCSDGITEGSVAAIVSIPKGQLGNCAALFAGSERRYDTRLMLRNSKVIVITAAAGTVVKSLTLKGSATVYIANLPQEMLSTSNWQSSGAAHYLAYYNLIKTSCGQQGLTPPTTSITACPIAPLSFTGEKPTKAGSLQDKPKIVDSECSNSAWP